MALTLQEILRQPDSWEQAIAAVARQEADLTALVQETRPDLFVFTGCGTSYYLAIAAAGFFQEITGLPARAVPASELLFSRPTHIPAGQKAALVAFSRSGETTETVVALRRHKEAGQGPTVGITCRAACSMNGIGDMTFALPAADDKSVVMTSSFTTMLMTSLLAAAGLAGDRAVTACLQGLPALLREQLDAQMFLGRTLGGNRAYERFVFLGMGPLFGIASEAMLKLKEMTQVPCETYSPLEFRHGPISIVGPGTLAVLCAGNRGGQHELRVLADIQKLGGQALVLSGAAGEGTADVAYSAGDQLPDYARALLCMPLLQLTAYFRAMTLGRDPDRPQHLTQVVMLDENDLA